MSWIIYVGVVFYLLTGIAIAIAMYKNDNTGLCGLGDTFWYGVVRSSVLGYSVLFGPVVIISFVILYIAVAIVSGVIELIALFIKAISTLL